MFKKPLGGGVIPTPPLRTGRVMNCLTNNREGATDFLYSPLINNV